MASWSTSVPPLPDAHIRAPPSKVAVAYLVDRAIGQGTRWPELGGTGLPGGGVARFKAGFAGVPAPVRVWQLVTHRAAHAALCAAAGVVTAGDAGWFPVYRRPRRPGVRRRNGLDRSVGAKYGYLGAP